MKPESDKLTPEVLKDLKATYKPKTGNTRSKLQVRIPQTGWVPNPFLAYGRNQACICGAEKKYKKCCLPNLPRLVPEYLRNKMKRSPETSVVVFFDWMVAEGMATRTAKYQQDPIADPVQEFSSEDVASMLDNPEEVAHD